MKNIGKSLILVSAATMAIGINSAFQPVVNMENKEVQKEIQAYNYNPSNILDNVFTEDNKKYLPFIYDNSNERINVDTIKTEFQKAGLDIKTISTGTKIGTGTQITTTDNSVYYVLVYGDVDGNGKVNLLDASKVISSCLDSNKALSGIYAKAANINNKSNTLNLLDASRLISFGLEDLKGTIVVQEPQSDRELDKTKPVITLKGNSTVTVQVGSGYADEGATATDNYDGDITGRIVVTNNVNPNVVGTYTVVYNITDSNGNVADTVTRTVKVVDIQKPVITLKGDNPQIIEVGSEYIELGATATDNYDTLLAISINAENVNTTTVGEYEVTYNAIDSSNNAAEEVKRTVKVIDVITSIEMKANPTTTTYNYGTSNVDLTGAEIQINWLSGKTETKAISESMLSSYSLSQLGDVTITVNHEGKTTNFKVNVIDAISSIEIETLPKTEYNYGTTNVDLVGATIQVNWLSGKTESKSITESMLSNYDLSSEGEKTITVNYEGYDTTFNVTILNKIAGIELVEEGRENVTTVDGGYKVTTTKDFTLGALKETQTTNTSKLEKSQVSVEVGLVTSEDSTATASDLQVDVVESNGNILLQGKALKAGNYTIDAFITYGENKISLSQIHLTAEKSNVIKEVSLEEIADEEIRYGLTEQVVKQVIVINENGENMEILAKELEISNISNGVTVTMLDENKDPISDGEIIVKYLEIQTTLTTKQNASFKMKSAEIETEISFLIGDKLVLSDVESSATNIPLYVEGQEAVNVVETDGRFYTILPINFKNQVGEKINVPAYNITASTTAADFADIEEGKVGIILPKAMRTVTVEGSSPIEKEGNVLDIKFYDEDDNEVTGANSVAKIGIALTIEEESVKIDLSTLEGKTIQLVCANQENAFELPIEVSYKKLVNLDITTESQENVTLDGEEYVVDVNKEFVLGTIVSGTYEEPVAESLLNTTVETTGSQDGIQISYEKDENGNILVKGKATKIGIYQITPYIEIEGNKVETKHNIIVRAEGLLTIEEIQLSKTEVVNGNATIAEITAISDANPTGETIKLEDIKVEAEEGISVEFLDVDEFPIDPSYVSETVCYLEITTSLTETATKTITITLYEGKTNEYTETITLQVNPENV